LPPGQAEGFAASFKKGTDKLNLAQDKLTKSRQLMPAQLPLPLKKVAVREFPTSRKRAMTGREAAEEQERDKARRRRREAQEAQEEHDENSFWATQMVAETQLYHSQRETQLVPETQLSALSQLSKTPSVELSFNEDDSGSGPGPSFTESSAESDSPNHEPRRSGRVKRPSQEMASQLSQEAAAARRKASKEGKGKRVRKAKLMNTSQLIEEFSLDQEE
jgi:hypothetical protein